MKKPLSIISSLTIQLQRYKGDIYIFPSSPFQLSGIILRKHKKFKLKIFKRAIFLKSSRKKSKLNTFVKQLGQIVSDFISMNAHNAKFEFARF